MPARKAPDELKKARRALTLAEFETSNERRIKDEIIKTAAKFKGASRAQCRAVSAQIGGLLLELKIAALEPANCPKCGAGLCEGAEHE